jgi:hypothetical protein
LTKSYSKKEKAILEDFGEKESLFVALKVLNSPDMFYAAVIIKE